MNKIKELSKPIFEKYSKNDCLYVGKFEIWSGTPNVEIVSPWEACDEEEIPPSIMKRNPIVTENPDECIDKLLLYLMDEKTVYSVPEGLICGTVNLYITKEGEMCYD